MSNYKVKHTFATMGKYKVGIDIGSTTAKIAILDADNACIFSRYERHKASPCSLLKQFFEDALHEIGNIDASLTVTGSVGLGVAETLQTPFVQEVVAATQYARDRYPEASAMIDIGGEDAKIVFFESHNTDLRMNGNCAGGTGAFIDQMAILLGVDPQELDTLARQATQLHPIAARCGVFSKTDIQNLMSRNVPKSDIAASIFHAIAVQTTVTLSRGHAIEAPIILCGGPLSFLPALRQAFAEYLHLHESDFIIPENGYLLPALGCALKAANRPTDSLINWQKKLSSPTITQQANTLPPLFVSDNEYQAWKSAKSQYNIPQKALAKGDQQAVIGIDSGSTTTKIVATDLQGNILFTYYATNNGNPIETVEKGLSALQQKCAESGTNLSIEGSCSTGYGEELIKAAYGLDNGIIETVAHYRAAKRLMPDVSFILDIGGQDMKAIFAENGAVTRMELNEACSSGCGSFIETFARTLGFSVSEFANMGCTANAPCDLGTRCTVFMNSKVKQVLREGASIADISAGLSYSVIKNCLYKVLKIKGNKELGKHIVVQGGTMRNDTIVRAFELLTKTEVARSNHPELMGAYGCALTAAGQTSTARDLKTFLAETNYTTRHMQCHGCENHCSVCRYTFPNGNAYFSGNKCENIFSNRGEGSTKGENIYSEKYKLLFERDGTGSINPRLPVIGIPRTLNMYEEYPFWHTLFTACGFNTVLSHTSTFNSYEQALQTVMSDNICFPAKLAHSHIRDLIDKGVDRIFMPYVVYEQKEDNRTANAYNCPIVSGYSDVIRNAMTPSIPIDSPAITFADHALLAKQCVRYLKNFGINRRTAINAVLKALEAQEEYAAKIQQRAASILAESHARERIAIVLAGRPYHTDPLIQHKISELIADLGVDVISDDIVRGDNTIPIKENYLVQQWSYINRILKAAAWTATQSNTVHFVQITSFGCGPDAFLLDEVRDMLHRHGKPFTLLKVDDVNNIGSLKLRIRSLIESLKDNCVQGDKKPFITTPIFKQADQRKKILAPYFSEYVTPLLPPLFKLAGYGIEVLPPDNMESADTGLKYANNEVCYPATVVTGSLIKALQSKRYDLNNVAVAITQTGGQCRATNYVSLIKRALISAGFKQVPVVTLGIHGNTFNEQEGFEIPWHKMVRITLASVLYADTISKFYHATAVRETQQGIAATLRDQYLKAAAIPISQNSPKGLLQLAEKAARDFDKACTDKTCPQVGIVGEIFLKFNSFSHQHIPEFLIRQGIEVIPPTLLPLFTQSFINMETNRKLLLTKSRTPIFAIRLLYGYVARQIAKFDQAASSFRYYIPFNNLYEDAEMSHAIVSEAAQFGEGWVLPAEVAAFARHGVTNVISLQPFGCIANHILSKGIEKRIHTLYPQLNFLSLDFDSGVSSVNVVNRLWLFIDNVKNSPIEPLAI